MHKKNVLILSSGGIDSTACIHFYKKNDFRVSNLFIDYGQLSNRKELCASKRVASYFNTNLETIKIKSDKQYKNGFAIGRNAFLLFAALMNFKYKNGIIAIGVHQGTNYMDCNQQFIERMQTIFDEYSDNMIKIGVPFLKFSKLDIWNYSLANKIPLALTYSCERGEKQPCNKCLSCQDLKRLYASKI